MQPDDPNPHHGTQPKESQPTPFVPRDTAPPIPLDSVQLDMSQLTADDVEKAFPHQTQEQEQALRMAVAQIVIDVQRNWDIARQAAVLLAGAQSIARLIGFTLKP